MATGKRGDASGGGETQKVKGLVKLSVEELHVPMNEALESFE